MFILYTHSPQEKRHRAIIRKRSLLACSICSALFSASLSAQPNGGLPSVEYIAKPNKFIIPSNPYDLASQKTTGDKYKAAILKRYEGSSEDEPHDQSEEDKGGAGSSTSPPDNEDDENKEQTEQTEQAEQAEQAEEPSTASNNTETPVPEKTAGDVEKSAADQTTEKQSAVAQMDELPPVSSAAHAAHLMRHTAIIATSNIVAHFDRESTTGINSGSSFSQNNFWGNINYFTGTNKSAVTGEYDLNSAGLTLGYDYSVRSSGDWTIGGAFTYAKGKADKNDKFINLDQDFYLGTLYSKFMFRQLDMLATVHFGQGKNQQEIGNSTTIKTDYDSTLYGVTLQGGYIISTGHIDVKPLIEFNYLNSSFDDINLSDNNSSSKIQNGDITVTEIGAGIQLFKTKELKDNKGQVHFHGQLMAYHDFNDDKFETTIPISISPLTTQLFNSEIKSQERYRAGVGIGIQTRTNLSLDLDYDYFWNDNSKVNAFALRVGYLF